MSTSSLPGLASHSARSSPIRQIDPSHQSSRSLRSSPIRQIDPSHQSSRSLPGSLPSSNRSSPINVPSMNGSNGKGGVSKRQHIVNEIVSTEETFVRTLEACQQHFLLPFQSILSPAESQTIAGSISTLVAFHEQFLAKIRPKQNLGAEFARLAPHLKIYPQYVNSHSLVTTLVAELSSRNKQFRQHLDKKQKDGYHLESLLIAPVQRIPRYVLLLKDLLKRTTPEHPEHDETRKALEQIQQIAELVNESKRESANTAALAAIHKSIAKDKQWIHENFWSLGSVIRRAKATRSTGKGKKSGVGGLMLASPRAKPCELFLFNDVLLWTNAKLEFKDHLVVRDSYWRRGKERVLKITNELDDVSYTFQFDDASSFLEFFRVLEATKTGTASDLTPESHRHVRRKSRLPQALQAKPAEEASNNNFEVDPISEELSASKPRRWVVETDPDSGDVYYHDEITGHTQWERPDNFPADSKFTATTSNSSPPSIHQSSESTPIKRTQNSIADSSSSSPSVAAAVAFFSPKGGLARQRRNRLLEISSPKSPLAFSTTANSPQKRTDSAPEFSVAGEDEDIAQSQREERTSRINRVQSRQRSSSLGPDFSNNPLWPLLQDAQQELEQKGKDLEMAARMGNTILEANTQLDQQIVKLERRLRDGQEALKTADFDAKQAKASAQELTVKVQKLESRHERQDSEQWKRINVQVSTLSVQVRNLKQEKLETETKLKSVEAQHLESQASAVVAGVQKTQLDASAKQARHQAEKLRTQLCDLEKQIVEQSCLQDQLTRAKAQLKEASRTGKEAQNSLLVENRAQEKLVSSLRSDCDQLSQALQEAERFHRRCIDSTPLKQVPQLVGEFETISRRIRKAMNSPGKKNQQSPSPRRRRGTSSPSLFQEISASDPSSPMLHNGTTNHTTTTSPKNTLATPQPQSRKHQSSSSAWDMRAEILECVRSSLAQYHNEEQQLNQSPAKHELIADTQSSQSQSLSEQSLVRILDQKLSTLTSAVNSSATDMVRKSEHRNQQQAVVMAMQQFSADQANLHSKVDRLARKSDVEGVTASLNEIPKLLERFAGRLRKGQLTMCRVLSSVGFSAVVVLLLAFIVFDTLQSAQTSLSFV